MFMARMAVVAVGSSLGLEGHYNSSNLCPEALQHVFDDVVGPDSQNLMSNVRRQMPISQMPGDSD
jgi:hypothetical protein